MGVDVNGNRQRRESRKKDGDLADKIESIISPEGSIDIDSLVSFTENALRNADKGGGFLGLKDGKLDAKEVREMVATYSKEYGVEVPENMRALINERFNEGSKERVDIRDTIEQLRDSLKAADRNGNGQINPSELRVPSAPTKGGGIGD